MTSSQAQTLATLEAFLDSQRQLIARTQSDLHKLTQLRERALEDPKAFIENVEGELDDPAFRMSEYVPPEQPEDIDWSLFSALDPSPFTTIPIPGPPPMSAAKKQLSEPSDLQKFVHDTSKRILADFKPFVPNEEDEGDGETKPGGAATELADNQRLAELVELGKHGDAHSQDTEIDIGKAEPRQTRVSSGLRLKPPRGALGANPGIDLSNEGKGKPVLRDKKQQVAPSPQTRPRRSRRPTVRPDEIYRLLSPSPRPSASPKAEAQPPETDPPPPPDTTFSPETPIPQESRDAHSDSDSKSVAELDGDTEESRTKKKAKTSRRGVPSETFNLPWTLSEQHLLEKLLEEIPPGEKKRWAKISKAMAGRRTPRQVASRVQKYFEKLKKFGVNPD